MTLLEKKPIARIFERKTAILKFTTIAEKLQ
jgi:hypothetical protein